MTRGDTQRSDRLEKLTLLLERVESDRCNSLLKTKQANIAMAIAELTKQNHPATLANFSNCQNTSYLTIDRVAEAKSSCYIS